MNKAQLIVDRALRLTAFDKETGEAKFMLTEVEDFQTTTAIDNEKTATSADGSTVATLENGKSGTMSGNASFLNFGLMAAQNGSEIKEASASNKIVTPFYESVEIKAGKATLTHIPVGTQGAEIGFIYTLNDDGTLKDKFLQGATATATEFALGESDGVISAPTGLADGTVFGVFYEYESTKTRVIENNANEFGGTYVVKAEVLCRDICNPDLVTYVVLKADSAKLSSAVDLGWNTDSKHPFEFKLQSAYCGKDGKSLFKTFILED